VQVNPTTALVFLRTRVALGGSKKPAHVEVETQKNAATVRFSVTTSSKKVARMIATTTDNRNSNMAAQTGNNNISGTMLDSVEIRTANLGFSKN